MSNNIPSTADAWEERQLGAEAQFAKPVEDAAMESRLDEALGLKMISIRIPERLIEDFKIIAAANGGMGYQTLMKQCLKRFADSELKRMARDMATDQQTIAGSLAKAHAKKLGQKKPGDDPPADNRKAA